MRTTGVAYIDTGDRLFERVIVRDYPTDGDGTPCRCVLNRQLQRIEVSEYVPADDVDIVCCRAIEKELGIRAGRLVPVVGVVRADGRPA